MPEMNIRLLDIDEKLWPQLVRENSFECTNSLHKNKINLIHHLIFSALNKIVDKLQTQEVKMDVYSNLFLQVEICWGAVKDKSKQCEIAAQVNIMFCSNDALSFSKFNWNFNLKIQNTISDFHSPRWSKSKGKIQAGWDPRIQQNRWQGPVAVHLPLNYLLLNCT